jgi:hypothetical protein
MIINDFLCKDCGITDEHRYWNRDIGGLQCPDCGSKNLLVQLSAPAVFTLNTKERINSALKKRSLNDHKKNFDDRRDAAREKYDKKWE